MTLKHSLILLSLSVLMTGCGLKGELYAPGDKPIIVNDSSVPIEKDEAFQSVVVNANDNSEDELDIKEND